MTGRARLVTHRVHCLDGPHPTADGVLRWFGSARPTNDASNSTCNAPRPSCECSGSLSGLQRSATARGDLRVGDRRRLARPGHRSYSSRVGRGNASATARRGYGLSYCGWRLMSTEKDKTPNTKITDLPEPKTAERQADKVKGGRMSSTEKDDVTPGPSGGDQG